MAESGLGIPARVIGAADVAKNRSERNLPGSSARGRNPSKCGVLERWGPRRGHEGEATVHRFGTMTRVAAVLGRGRADSSRCLDETLW